MDAVLENFIFYIFQMYEFLHSQGHLRHSQTAPAGTFVRSAPKATFALQCDERSEWVPFASDAPQQIAYLFDHLIGGDHQRLRHCDAEGLGGLEIDKQFNFRGLLDRQIGGCNGITVAS